MGMIALFAGQEGQSLNAFLGADTIIKVQCLDDTGLPLNISAGGQAVTVNIYSASSRAAGTLVKTYTVTPDGTFGVAGYGTFTIHSDEPTLVVGTTYYMWAVRTDLTGTSAATGTAVLTSTAVSSVTIGSGGTGYDLPPIISFSGGAGSGATAHAVLTAGVVTSIVIDTGGTGYTSAPTVSFSQGGRGSTSIGRTATALVVK